MLPMAMEIFFKSCHQRCSVKKGILKNCAKFTENTCARVSFFKISLWHRCFPVNFAKFLRTPFLQNTSGRVTVCFKRMQ